MSDPQTDAEKHAWLTQHFGEISTTSYTEDNLTAFFADELYVINGDARKMVRGFGSEMFNPVSNLFNAVMAIKDSEHFETASGRKLTLNREHLIVENLVLKAA